MPTSAGTRVGVYEVVGLLGAGGMGEVYRARDTRLERDVAIKVLPEEFAAEPERLARFEREAKLLASLSHQNIAGIYGLEEASGVRYLILEFIEGESLADRLTRGPLPVDEAVAICRQIATGVEAAHEAGVVHRDLKPGNVMLRSDGIVKVLDFGLAKSDGGDRARSSGHLSTSPTATAATIAGVLLGTAAYMSPEQARGRAVDKRSDVWSFGCILYECLTGRPAFGGDTVSDTIASILKTEPDLSALPADLPARVRELLLRCLCKDPRERLRDIGEARVLLGDSATVRAIPPPTGPTSPRLIWWMAAAAALVLTAATVAITQFAGRHRAPAPVRKFDLAVKGVGADWSSQPQLSPDGSRIVYCAGNHIWIRPLDQLDPRSVADVEGNSAVCWSPDSREIAFEDRKKLWKVSASGGDPVELCEVPGTGKSIGAAWSPAGILAMSIWRGGIYAVPAAGGAPRILVDIEPGKIVDFHAPSWLANGDLLYSVHWTAGDGTGGHDLEVLRGGRRMPVAGGLGQDSESMVTSSGKLLFIRRSGSAGIWAVDFDLQHLRMKGEPRLVAASAISVSAARDGSLLYVLASDVATPAELVWVDRTGKVLESTGSVYPGIAAVTISPDRGRAAFTAQVDGQSDVWVRDLRSKVDTRISFTTFGEFDPQWIGPGRISYVQDADSGSSLRCRIVAVDAGGSGHLTALAPPTGSSAQHAFFAPGGVHALRVIDEAGHGRLRISDVQPDGSLGSPRPFLRFTPEPDVRGVRLNLNGAALSPDGRLVVYENNDERHDLFVARFPGGEGPWQVSAGGGENARWAPGSEALYYVAGTGSGQRWLTEVKIDTAQDPPVGRTTRLFDMSSIVSPETRNWSYAVDADGRRFLVARTVPGAAESDARMVLVQNWEAALAK